MPELVGGNAGKVSYKLKFEAGKLVAEAEYDGGVVDGGAFMKLDSDAVIEALKKAIPGTIDDLLLDQAKKLLKELA